MDFYAGTISRLCGAGKLDRSATTLVVGGGKYDAATLRSAGFSDVTISNLDDRMRGDEFAPYKWAFQDAENLTYRDGEFAQVLVHAALHHCRSPHKALAEMYRVAEKSVVVFEARDSVLMRAAVRLGLTTDYEVEAVVANNGTHGGLLNSATPNYVYRWTERELEKTIRTFDPTGPVPVEYFYGLRLPLDRLRMHRNKAKAAVAVAATVPAKLLAAAFPRQCNEFAIWIGKPESRWPWLGEDNRINQQWAARRFNR